MERLVSPHPISNVGASLSLCGASGTRYSDNAQKGASETNRRQSEGLQSPARPEERLSCPEIRHLFWQLVLVVEQRASTILQWSCWRRQHGSRAQAAHYARREREMQRSAQSCDRHAAEDEQQQACQREVIEIVWRRLVALLPNEKRTGRPFDHDRRLILEAIVHVMQTGCGWRGLPPEFPPWQTVYSQLTQWRTTGIWEKIWAGLAPPHPSR